MKAAILVLTLAFGLVMSLAGCGTTAQQRGPFHEYLHEHGLE